MKKIVLYTYDIFTTPTNLIFYLISRFFTPKPLFMSTSEFKYCEDNAKKIKYYIIDILGTWVNDRTLDFVRYPELLTILEIFLRDFAYPEEKDESLSDFLKSVHNLVRHVSEEVKVIKLGNDETPPRVRDYRARFSVPSMHHNRSIGIQNCGGSLDNIGLWYQVFSITLCETVASQLTLIDWKNFSKINISELMCKRWLNKNKQDCPFYWKYVNRFNNFNYWLQYILLSQESCTRRDDMVAVLLKVAEICIRQYRNYCSSHYIFSTLLTLKNNGVIMFDEEKLKSFNELKEAFVGNDIKGFEKMELPAIPNINYFLSIFLKL